MLYFIKILVWTKEKALNHLTRLFLYKTRCHSLMIKWTRRMFIPTIWQRRVKKMKKIIPHIYLHNCKEALQYYQQVFGGELKNVETSDGKEMFKGHEGKYIHAELHINESCVLYFADVFSPVTKGNNIWLTLDLESEDEIKSIFTTLAKDGQVKMELQDTFWNSKYGVVIDKYGVVWELNYAK